MDLLDLDYTRSYFEYLGVKYRLHLPQWSFSIHQE